MKILLDFDGVMVTTPTWRSVERLEDGFMAFNSYCVANLARVLSITPADIVLTTTHRIHHSEAEWYQLLLNRGIKTDKVSKVNSASTFKDLSIRCIEVLEWVDAHSSENFVIIDDDKSLRDLPTDIKARWVETNFHQGLTKLDSDRVLDILLSEPKKISV